MYTWEDLQKSIKQQHRLTCKLHRKPSVQLKYDNDHDRALRSYASFEDYIKIQFMKWKCKKDSSNKFVAVKCHWSKRYVINHCMYPFDTVGNIKSYVMWFDHKPVDMHIVSHRIQDELSKMGKLQVIWFVVSSKDFPNIWCSYVFVLQDS
jgi:hypothetical protein